MQKDNMPDDERRAGYGGGRFSLRALILLLLTSAFISGFLTGALPCSGLSLTACNAMN
ncbi:hypothetical protein ABM565_002555 [Salmonella enterica subsp. enterica serovar Bredeney]|nr:hypothetical protein [Salmonella enterica subsp. enterica serovar Bredeney]EEP5173947.1 hypothetical protein [Salmonella enterica subsp. enterica serovar Bredeney]EGM6733237.1 hypothetical protein [Salmonella enterica]EKK2234215.1 hypothetical protein [Salmonella enterica subsp. enterica serovar Bredeney]HCK5324573.1 hypothetical protein [Salmonella enterica subsp. enterica serovar Bredeney]